MRREWELEDFIDCWTLDEEDVKLLANKSGATRLAFALARKFFELDGRSAWRCATAAPAAALAPPEPRHGSVLTGGPPGC